MIAGRALALLVTPDPHPLLLNLSIASLMVMLTVCTHLAGLTGLIALMRRTAPQLKVQDSVMGQALLILGVVFGIFAIHSVEIWMYAVTYELLGSFRTFEEALYFSTVSFTTVGFGDLVLPERWRLVSAIEAANGFVLIGWSTAFLVSVTGQLRLLESEIEEELEEREKVRARRRSRR